MKASVVDAERRDNRLIADSLKIRYTPFAVARGEGAYLFDLESRRYLDFSAGWAVAQLGYSDARVRHAIERQLALTTFAGLISSINTPALDLAEKLISLVPGEFPKKVWFGQSGSDASEVAQRLVLRATGRRRLVSFIGSWHGTTDAAMGLSGHPSFAATPGGAHVTKAPYPNPYRPPFGDDGESPEVLADRCLRFLEHYLFQTICPPQDVAAVFVEAVQSDAGDIVPPPNFLPGLRALCDRHGILLVVDEVKAGLGRSGRMFAFEHSNITPDLVLLGKALGGGLPMSAIVGRAEVLDAGSGALFTTVGNGTCCAAGLATICALEADGLVEQAAVNGRYLHDRLACALEKFNVVGDVRGLGLIQGVELVRDRDSKEPNQQAAAKIVYRAWELGLILFYAGNWGNVLEITPPLVITQDQIDEGVAILEQSIADVLAGKVGEDVIAPYAGW